MFFEKKIFWKWHFREPCKQRTACISNTVWPKCAPASSFEIINDSVERSHLEKRLSAELISTIIYQEMKPTLSACNSNRFSTLATVHIHICILRRSHLGQSASQGFRFTVYNNSLFNMDSSYANFTNTTFQKEPRYMYFTWIPSLTHTL